MLRSAILAVGVSILASAALADADDYEHIAYGPRMSRASLIGFEAGFTHFPTDSLYFASAYTLTGLIGYGFTPKHSAYIELTGTPSYVKVGDDANRGSVGSYYYGLRYQFTLLPMADFTPTAQLGVGQVHIRVEYRHGEKIKQTSSAFSLGLGFQYRYDDAIGLALGYRLISSSNDAIDTKPDIDPFGALVIGKVPGRILQGILGFRIVGAF